MTYWKSPEFKALQKAWYQRLAAEGFEDAEKLVDDDLVLRQTAAFAYRHAPNTLSVQSRADYFAILSQCVQAEQNYRSDIDKLVMVFASEGKKPREICRLLQEKGYSRFRRTITFLIRRYEMRWGLRQYTRAQLNLATK